MKIGWIVGENIRYLRLCTHKVYFQLAWQRLQGALAFWGYPKALWNSPPILWERKSMHVNPH